MTVEFIKQWNGYGPGDSDSFSAAVEADLVRLGFANSMGGNGLVPAMTRTGASGNTVLVRADGRIINLAKNSSSKFRPSNGGGLVMAACSSTTGYTKSQQGGTSTLAVAAVPAGGPNVRKGSSNLLRITNDTVSMWTALEKAVTATPNPSKRTDFWFYIPDYSKISTLTLYLSVAADYLNYYSVTVTPLQKNGWQVFSIADTEWVVSGSPTFDTITKIKFRATPVAGKAVDIYWDRAVYSPSGIPQVCLMWDDGQLTDYTHVAPLLEKYGLKGTFSIITDLIGGTGFMTWDQVHALEEAGHEIVVHGQYGLSSLADLAAATADIEHNRDTLVTQGFTEATDIYVFPQGIYQMATGDDSLVNYLAANNWRGAFLAGATSYVQGDIDPLKYVIGRAKIQYDTVAATCLAMLDVASAARRSFISVSHEVV
ncbi:polysaccharide deacetylase family protein, partial [Ideonella sp.]|uniref:polysaccharide deacetylase family protein n=1 Tax=Ideonella sp. TaxID=1929293 RepID=UPI003BB6D6DE